MHGWRAGPRPHLLATLKDQSLTMWGAAPAVVSGCPPARTATAPLLLPGGGVSGTSPRGAAVGLGCAFVLWVGVLPFVLSTSRRANVRVG